MCVGVFGRFALAALAGMVSACAHLPPPTTAGCQLPAYRLVINDNGLGASIPLTQDTDQHAFRKMVSDTLSKAHALRGRGEDVLILSGGSQHGAYGAGFFAGMAKSELPEFKDGVPEYVFVTGVSTGALVSTLVFLANARSKADAPTQPTCRAPASQTSKTMRRSSRSMKKAGSSIPGTEA